MINAINDPAIDLGGDVVDAKAACNRGLVSEIYPLRPVVATPSTREALAALAQPPRFFGRPLRSARVPASSSVPSGASFTP